MQQHQSVPYQMAQAPLHPVTDDGVADGLAHDETRTRRGSFLPRRVRVRSLAQMHDEARATGPASSAYRVREVLAPPQPVLGRQHVMDLRLVLRPTGGSDPCRGGSPGSRDRHGSAYAAGSRGSSRDDGCSAGRCACSLGGSRGHLCLGEALDKTGVGRRLAVTVRPREARNARLHRFLTLADLAHRRQAAAAIDNSTSLRYARPSRPVKPDRSGGRPRLRGTRYR